MIRISDVLDKIDEHTPGADLDIVDRAYIFSARVHDGQVRLSGEPYLSHPLEVAGLLADMRLDPVSIAAGLLHDVVEDTHADEKEIEEIFGSEVLHIVSGVTKLSKLNFSNAAARQAESIRKMFLAMADDIRVILIKLADRLHNMRTLSFHKESKRKNIAAETLDIYAPIASRLGIYWIKLELEDTAFMYLMPEEYERIKNKVKTDKDQRDDYIEKVRHMIAEEMKASHMPCQILGRHKHYYSIYKKMKEQNLDFEDIYDIIAFRIIVDTTPQCYEALGLMHSRWKPIDIKFKDYIGRPKPNMYQSLHTTVMGHFNERMEIQIRTQEMDKVAKSGIAAHWSYKEGKSANESVSEKFAWIQNLIENQENFTDPDEFMENVRIDLFPDDVYVFTPTGEIRSLPKGATPIDFAYMIHSEVGHQCTGAKVNGRMVPLKRKLKTGDCVDIITLKGHSPSKDWLNIVKTVKATSRIRQWIKTQDKERSISLGREMCEKEFRKNKLNYNRMIKSPEMENVLAAFGFKKTDDLIANVGYGKITPLQVVKKLVAKDAPEESHESILEKILEKVRKKKKERTGVIVKGLDDILVKFGKCCQPVPGDSITGYITRGQGVTIHKKRCINAKNMNQDRRIEVSWNEDTNASYPVTLSVLSNDRMGLLADLTTSISNIGANILSVNSETYQEENTVKTFLTVSVENTAHLKKIVAGIKRVKQVHRVKRIYN
ncbi:bifunctional (p)ppGpp synthetase/guanosine-3',5'-bis(diphosphate) 3'-pyrophosphohydrolase [Desulfobacterales bacterium HSG16]|nr:bifunctional (p)ppGpp synthetase/guanosine-3',5'-bis(diphosphate) 3'-pyrophosphohydrolase [Desulfobacterales bacterium HSG16]